MKLINITIQTLSSTVSAELLDRQEVEHIDLAKTLPKFKRDIQDLAVDYGFEFKPGLGW